MTRRNPHVDGRSPRPGAWPAVRRAEQGPGWQWIIGVAVLFYSRLADVHGAEHPVYVRTVGETAESSGMLAGLTATEAVLAVEGGRSWTVPRQELRAVWVASALRLQPTPAVSRWQVLLTNGDRLTGDEPSIGDEVLQLRRDSTLLRIPLEFIRGWWRSTAAAKEDALRDRRVTRLRVAADTLFLPNGDRLTGELLAWDAKGLRWRTAVGEQTLNAEQAAGVILDPELTAVPDRPVDWALVQLRDGSRLSITDASFDGEKWRLQLQVGAELWVPWEALQRIDFFGERVQPLTVHAPAQDTSVRYLSFPTDYQLDRNQCGAPLALRGDVAAWGVGVNSGSRLVWSIEPGWTTFETMVGIDDAAAGGGSARFVVRADGVELCRSEVLTGRDPPRTLGPLPLGSVRELELLVESADRGDIGDIADWVRPVLMK